MDSFGVVLARAISAYIAQGYSDAVGLNQTLKELRAAANEWLPSEAELETYMRNTLTTIFKRQVVNGAIIKQFPGVSRFTLERIAPSLRGELDRRIMASTSLIKLNREQAIDKTLQRFSGWATSIPVGGTKTAKLADLKVELGTPLKQARYEVRRLNIDQGHKMLSNIAAVMAQQTNAIAAMWHHTHQMNYDGRPEHIARDGKIYALRGNWALEQGLMTKCDGYSDEIDQPAFFCFCRCKFFYINTLGALPDHFLTQKGRDTLAGIRRKP